MGGEACPALYWRVQFLPCVQSIKSTALFSPTVSKNQIRALFKCLLCETQMMCLTDSSHVALIVKERVEVNTLQGVKSRKNENWEYRKENHRIIEQYDEETTLQSNTGRNHSVKTKAHAFFHNL